MRELRKEEKGITIITVGGGYRELTREGDHIEHLPQDIFYTHNMLSFYL